MSAIFNTTDENCRPDAIISEKGNPVNTSTYGPCSNSQVGVVRHDYLIIPPIGVQNWVYPNLPRGENFGPYWVEQIHKHNYSLLVVNSRGIHFVETPIVLRELNETLSYLYHHHPNISIIYRSTATGHAGCEPAFRRPPLQNQTLVIEDPH